MLNLIILVLSLLLIYPVSIEFCKLLVSSSNNFLNESNYLDIFMPKKIKNSKEENKDVKDNKESKNNKEKDFKNKLEGFSTLMRKK